MAIAELLQGGTPSAKFPDVGATHTGTVIEAEPVQARDFDSGELKTWDDGKPMMQIRVTIQTAERDPEIADDDGVRSVFVKAWGDQLKALKKAIREAGDDDIRPGGTFTATYVGDGEKPKRGYAPKLYAYSYSKPSGAASLLKAADPAPAAAPAPAAQPAPAEVDPAYAAFLAYQASQAA